jgi:hypothetical protein
VLTAHFERNKKYLHDESRREMKDRRKKKTPSQMNIPQKANCKFGIHRGGENIHGDGVGVREFGERRGDQIGGIQL